MTSPLPKGRGGRRHRLLYNNDRGFLDRLEPSAGVDGIVHELVGRLRGTRIDTLVARLDRGNLVPFYDSAVEGPLGKGLTRFPTVRTWRSVAIMRRLFDAGVDPWAAAFAAARDAGMAAFAGLRMNDLHHTKQKPEYQAWDDLFVSRLAKEERCVIGPDIDHFPMLRWRDDGPSQALNFLCEEVREHRYQIVAELADRYDVDGIELDFLRHGLFFPRSRVAEGAPLLTALLRRIRSRLDTLERQRRHALCLMVRVPASAAGCQAVGIDVATWIRDELVDIVAPYAIWEVEFHAPVEQFVALARDTHCEVVTGFDTAMDRPYRLYTPEMARAGAAWYYQQGVDGIYLFNCHMHMAPSADASAGDVDVVRPADHHALYTELHDPQALQFRSKRYVVSRSFGRERPVYPKQLPVQWLRQEAGTATSSRRISIGMAEDTRLGERLGLLGATQLRLRWRGLCEEDEVTLAFNGYAVDAPLTHLLGDGGSIVSGTHLATYPLSPSWIERGLNVVDVTLAGSTAPVAAPIELLDMEVAVCYRSVPIVL